MSRKDIFTGFRPPAIAPDLAAQTALERPGRNRIRPILGSPELISDTSRSPVGAIGQSLSEVSERNRRAEEIEKRLASGLAVVSLETADIDASFIPDRMPGAEEDHERLVASLRDNGQQAPILVRPHPDRPGRYQVAFGHRRLRAATVLGIRIDAVVRDLDDAQLVIAQGQENNERQDLSYIEKARFAQRLSARFPRDVIMTAMSLYKSDLSNMLSVAARIPAEVIDAIGPAPGIGRRSWMDLADCVEKDGVLDRIEAFLTTGEARALTSKERFKAVLSLVRPGDGKAQSEILTGENGSRLGKLSYDEARVELVVDRRQAPDFARFVMEQLPMLFEEYRSKDRQ